MTANKKSRIAYAIVAVIVMTLMTTSKYVMPSILTFLYFQYVSMYAYARTSRCPLYIVVRNNPKYYYRLFRRMYKKRSTEMLVVYIGFVLVLLTTVTLKLFL